MRKLLCLFVLGFFSVSVSAANWLDLGKSNDNNTQTFLDLDSIKKYNQRVLLSSNNENYNSAFVQFTYINNHENRKEGWYYSKNFVIANCIDESFYTPSVIIYGFKDEVIDSYQDKNFTKLDFNVAFPETVAESIIKAICY